MPAEMTPVNSSNIAAVGWSAESGLLVTFKSGLTYAYPDAPESAKTAMLAAASPGGYFSRFIRPLFDGSLV